MKELINNLTLSFAFFLFLGLNSSANNAAANIAVVDKAITENTLTGNTRTDNVLTDTPLGQETLLNSLDCPCPQLLAHRGASGNHPDSSLLAFQKAKLFQSDVLELDVHLSKDGHIVISHDASLKRTTGKDIDIADTDLKTIQAADAGFTFKDKQGHYIYRGKSIRTITLESLLKAFPRDRYNIELKANDIKLADKLWAFIKKHQLQKRVIVASAHSDVLHHYRSIKSDDALTSAHTSEIIAAYFSSIIGSDIEQREYDILQIPHNFLTKSMVDFFHKNGIPVQVWTVNKERDIKRMLAIGVDGIMTDFPERALPIYIAQGLKESKENNLEL